MSEKKKSKLGTFAVGAAIGVGLGMLFSPKNGSENRKELKKKLEELVEKVKAIDVEEVKATFLNKVDDLKAELEDLDREKALDIAKKKTIQLKEKAQELVDLSVEKGTPYVKNIAEDVRLKAIDVTNEVLKKLENK